MKEGFDRHQINYLLFVRLVPVFPGGLISIACVLCKVPFFRFIWTTVLGWVPASLLYTNLGIGLGEILESGKDLSWDLILNWKVMPYLIVMAILSILPILIKKKKNLPDA